MGVHSLWILFGIINVICLAEYHRVAAALTGNKPQNLSNTLISAYVIGTCFYLNITMVFLNWLDITWLALAMVWPFLYFIQAIFSHSESPITRLGSNILGLLWITLPCALFVPISLLSNTYEPYHLLGVILMIWASDSFAYIFGSLFGKTPLHPRISPKKTWEGILGGLISCLIIAVIFSRLLPDWSLFKWMGLASIAVVIGTTGDLVESLLKRSVNIKDTGTFLPGHGGFLDRFDALLFSTPFIFAFLAITS